MNIPFSKVAHAGNEKKYIEEVLASGWLTTASKTREFEEKFARYVNAPYACALNSGTAALHLGLEAMGVKKGDKVFVPSMTFTATAEVVRYLQADPVFLDTEYGTNLITPEILKEAINNYPGVKYLIIVHYGGQPAEMTNNQGTGILEICKENGISVLEDAAHAFPAKLNETAVGNIGDITCFSFYANKTITTAEGGMLTTKNETVFQRVKKMRLHGIDRDIWNRYTTNKQSWEYNVIAPGYKYNMPDLNAALGLAQLEKAGQFRRRREEIALYYYKHLNHLAEYIDLPLLKIPSENHAWHLFPVVIKEKSPVNRNTIIKKFAEKGIGTSVHYKPLHHMTYYKNKYHLKADSFPNTEKTWQGNLSLPIYPDLKTEELEYICKQFNEILQKF